MLTLRANLVPDQDADLEDRELVMRIPPLFRQQREAATQTGIGRSIEQGRQQGVREERRRFVESL